jgi:hypothetical protein
MSGMTHYRQTYLHLPIVSDTLQKTYSRLFDTFQLHTNHYHNLREGSKENTIQI